MIMESPNWRVIRRCGIGDREHVRSGLLSVGIFPLEHPLEALAGTFAAADQLHMMARVHLNVEALSPQRYQAVIDLMHRNSTHQFIEHGSLNEQLFTEMFETLEFVVVPLGQPDVEDLTETMLLSWRSGNARFLRGNHAHYTNEELRVRYPWLYPDPLPHYEAFLHADPL